MPAVAKSQRDDVQFSIEAFVELFRDSAAKQYMSKMDIEQIRRAVEEKDEYLLKELWPILLAGQTRDEEIVRNFVMTKNKILDDYDVEVVNIRKKFVDNPKKQKLRALSEKEANTAENILGDL